MVAPGGSSFADACSFSTRVDEMTPVDVKLYSIGKLTGLENYRIWSALMTIILNGIQAYEGVIDGVVPTEGADATEVDAYNHLCHTASTIFIQVVSQDILEKIVELEKPNLMWTWLRTEYYRDSAYALVCPIMNPVWLPCKDAYASMRLHKDMVAHVDSSDYICRRVDVKVRL